MMMMRRRAPPTAIPAMASAVNGQGRVPSPQWSSPEQRRFSLMHRWLWHVYSLDAQGPETKKAVLLTLRNSWINKHRETLILKNLQDFDYLRVVWFLTIFVCGDKKIESSPGHICLSTCESEEKRPLLCDIGLCGSGLSTNLLRGTYEGKQIKDKI